MHRGSSSARTPLAMAVGVFAFHEGISGTTLATGNFTFQIQVQDNIGAKAFLTVNYKRSKPRPEPKPEAPQARAAAAHPITHMRDFAHEQYAQTWKPLSPIKVLALRSTS